MLNWALKYIRYGHIISFLSSIFKKLGFKWKIALWGITERSNLIVLNGCLVGFQETEIFGYQIKTIKVMRITLYSNKIFVCTDAR